MRKSKKEKMDGQQSDINSLISKYQEQCADVDKKLSSLEGMSDASQKILKLLELESSVSSMSYRLERDLDKIAEQHVRDDRLFRKSAHVYSDDKYLKEKQLRAKNPGIDEVEKAISRNRAPINKMLNETVRACHGNLAEVSRSPFYPQAWKEHEPLRDLFAAAKAAREALGEDAPASSTAPEIKKKAPTLRCN